MKITSVEIHPDKSSDFLTLSFRDPLRGYSYNVKEMAGLDAEAITPRFYGPTTTNFYNLSLEKRDVVIKISLNPKFGQNESYSDLRDNLYKMISSSRIGKSQLQFKNGTDITAVISGFMTKFETSNFDQTPEVQLTFNCDDPYLMAPNPVAVPTAGLGFTNILITDDQSTAPHGFSFEIGVIANLASTITISDPTDNSWHFQMVLGWGLLAGDTIFANTDSKNRQLYVVRGAQTYYIADWIGAGSVWPVIFPGDNHFAFTNPTVLAWHNLSYYPTYWGI